MNSSTSEAVAPQMRGKPGSALLWVAGSLLVVFLYSLDYRYSSHGIIREAVVWGRDFINVWTSGKAVLAGRTDLLYDLGAYHQFQMSLFGPLDVHNYSYPPLTLPLMVPFALLPYGVALAAWLVLTGGFFLWAAAPWWKQATIAPVWLVVLTPAAMVNIWNAHYGFLLGGLLLLGWRLIEYKKPVLAGICFGLMAIKPHIAILVPLILLLRGEWRAIASAALTTGLLVVLSVILWGAEPWQAYIGTTLGVQANMVAAQEGFFRVMSTSVSTALTMVHAPDLLRTVVQIIFSLTGIVLVALAARKATLRDTALLAATATFLVLPYAFNYDLTVSAMAAAMLLAGGTLRRWEYALAILGFGAAQWGMALATQGLPLMPLFLLGLVIVQYRVAMRNRHPTEA